ncbi:MAG: hypothetical protein EA379_01565 [Phycisphaerales bacterium]|nr:MAG: hypothetical protein EA379_01565 [Phycisphaerales bacterium]
MPTRTALTAIASSLAMTIAVAASIVGFVETFDDDSANWRNAFGTAVLDWFPDGGPDNSAYASSLFNLSGTSPGGFPPTVIRAQSNFNSSGGAYVGDWIAAGVTGVTFDFRHNLTESITLTGRFATPINNPGASTETTTLIAPNTWTSISIDLTPDSADFISFGSGNYNSIFSNIGNIQIGFNVPEALAGQDIDGRFDIDNFRIVPAPGAAAALALLGAAAARRRRA